MRRHGRTLVPLTQRPGGLRAYKMLLPPAEPEAELRTHEGYEWMYVLSGRVRLRLADLDFVMKAGEAAEFDTRTPHWFGSADPEPAELLVLFGPQGERIHIRARPRTKYPPTHQTPAYMTSDPPTDRTRFRSANYGPAPTGRPGTSRQCNWAVPDHLEVAMCHYNEVVRSVAAVPPGG